MGLFLISGRVHLICLLKNSHRKISTRQLISDVNFKLPGTCKYILFSKVLRKLLLINLLHIDFQFQIFQPKKSSMLTIKFRLFCFQIA